MNEVAMAMSGAAAGRLDGAGAKEVRVKGSRAREVRADRARPAPAAVALVPERIGLALVLIGPEGRGKDVLIAAARRRFACDERLSFPLRVITRMPGASDEHLHVSRRVFRDMERERSFLVSWRAGEHGFALPEAARQLIQQGRIVVFAGTPEMARRLEAEGSPVRIVAVNAGPDSVRARLAAGAQAAVDPGQPVQAFEISHAGDIADAVRRFHALLLAIKDEVVLPAASKQPPAPVPNRKRATDLKATGSSKPQRAGR